MNFRRSKIIFGAVLLLIFLFARISSGAVLKNATPKTLKKTNLITMPFMKNKGQIKDANVCYYSNTFAGMVAVAKDGSISYHPIKKSKEGKIEQNDGIRENFVKGLKLSPSGEEKAVAKVSYFLGIDPKNWVKDISTFNMINIGEIYDGVQLKLKARGNNVEKFFFIRPKADPKKIRLRIDRAKSLSINPKGELKIDTGPNAMRFSKPVAYQIINGKKKSVRVKYTVQRNTYGFKVENYDTTKELIIDPLITAFFIGETEETTAPSCMATDSEGNVYVAGFSASSYSIFKFDSRLETLLRSVLFGNIGYNSDRSYDPNIFDMVIDRQNNVFVTGYTDNDDFPVTENAFDQECAGEEGFVTKFNSDLNNMLTSTFIGASDGDRAHGLAIDNNGNVYVTGQTDNPVSEAFDGTPFPTSPDAYDTNPGHFLKTKAFVMLLDSNLETMLAGTLLGYNGDLNEYDYLLDDCATEITIDANGDIVVSGTTESAAFPISAGSVDTTFQGESEVFIAKFDPNLQRLIASTFLGGLNDEKPNDLAIDSNNEIVVAGWTLSSDFPVINGSYDASYNLYEDGFVTKLDSSLTQMIASTYIGGGGADQVNDIFIQTDGAILLAGGTGSEDFPTTPDCHDDSYNGRNSHDFYEGDGFITILDNSLATCQASTFLGGSHYDHNSSILVNNEDLIVAGETWSDNFPYMTERKGFSDTFICRFNAEEDPLPLPVARLGHWQSENTRVGRLDAIVIHLNIDICADGTFSGMWRFYFCSSYIPQVCFIDEDGDTLPPHPVSGDMDIEGQRGTITLDNECQNIPFIIDKQTPDEMRVILLPEDSDRDCTLDFDIYSTIYFKGESTGGQCKDTSGSGGSGGGGGGCFVNTMMNK